MKKLSSKRTVKQQGFTLLEILVVVAIMGFLVAMVAPRFAGITSGTSQTVCNTSKGRGEQMISMFYEKEGRYPNGLVNLVMTDSSQGDSVSTYRYQVPYVDDDDADNGKEVIRSNHNNNFKFMIHYLNADEAEELQGLGVSMFYNLNEYGEVLDDPTVSAGETVGTRDAATHTGRTGNWQDVEVVGTGDMRPRMEKAQPQAGVGVVMSTVGASSSTENTFIHLGNRKPPSGRNDYFGRIIFGLGPESELVTSGIAAKAGISPTATNSEDFIWGGYYLVMPRLKATVERLKATGATLTQLNQTGGGTVEMYSGFLSSGEVMALGYPRGTDFEPGQIRLNNPNKFTERSVNLLEVMEPWDFTSNPVHEDLRWSLVWQNT
jgi:prepilin-type N-terminal cleavage/methylation domain-containing protein